MNEKGKGIIEIDVNKSKIVWGLFWKFMERGASQVVQLGISLVLARLLSPDDYGVIALISVFVQISSVFVTSGFSTSLIQKKNADLLDFSSAFYFSLFLSGILYSILFGVSPYVADFYGNSQITLVLRVIALQLFPNSIYSIQSAYISRSMQFKKLFWNSILSAAISGSVGIFLALNGKGVWALVAQSMVSSLVTVCMMFFLIDWKPKIIFSIKRIRLLMDFGSKMLGISMLDQIFASFYTAIIGKTYTTEMLGIYNRGQQFPQMISSNIEGAVTGVVLPVLTACNNDIILLKEMVRKIIKGYTYIIVPCLMGMAAVAEPLILTLLTEKWIASIPYLKVFCFIYINYTLNSINIYAFYALGKSGLVFKMQIIKKVAIVIEVLFSIRYGIKVLMLSQLLQSIFECLLHSYFAKREFDYLFIDQVKDVVPQILSSIVMYILVSAIAILKIPMMFQLIIQIIIGGIIYFFISKFFRISAFDMFMELIKERIGKFH